MILYFAFRIPHFTFLLCFVLMLTSCGFHLRKSSWVPTPLQNIEFHSHTPYAPLELALKRRLLTHAEQSAQSTSAVVLEIIKSESQERPRAISGDKRLEEIEIIYQVTFQVRQPDNKILIAPTTLSRSESMLYNRNFALGKQYERQELEQELALQLVEDILYRLAL